VGLLERVFHDARHSVRVIVKTPVVSAVAIVSLALGLGANTAIFSVIDSLLVRALPVERPGELARLEAGENSSRSWTNPVWEQIRDRQDLFAGAFAVSPTRFNLAPHGQSDAVEGLWASGKAFDVLGVRALVGRTLTEADDRPGGGASGPVAVISHAFWQRRFGGAPDAIGRTIVVDGVPFAIVGVTPPGFFGVYVGRSFDVALPIGAATLTRPASMLGRSYRWLGIMVRLKPDQTLASGTALLRALQPQILEATRPTDWHPSQIRNYLKDPFRLEPAATGDSFLRERYRRPLQILMTVVGLVLLIACANLAHLLLARANARRQEVALRMALGASRSRVAQLLLMESLLLAGAGALLGLLIARWSSALLVRQLSTETSTAYLDLSLDWRVLTFTASASIATALLFGTVPALRSAREVSHDALKAGGRGLAGVISGRADRALLVVQVALSMVLLVTAGLFLRTFTSLAQLDLGFDRHAILTASVEIPRARLATGPPPALIRELLTAAQSIPGVASAGVSLLAPLDNQTWRNLIELPDGPNLPEADRLTHFNIVTSGWFDTYRTPLLDGRDFSGVDTVGSPPVAIVNRAFARRFAGGRNPIGLRVKQPGNVIREVIGYVGDAAYESIRAPAPPTLYLPYSQETQGASSLVVSVRAAGSSPALLTQPLVTALSRVHGDLVVTPRPLDDHVSAALARERILAALSALFGGLALLLAGLGLYGITSFTVSRRRAEIGVRMALGATSRHVLSHVLTRVVTLVAVGIGVGIAVSLWATRFVSPLLFGLAPTDPVTFVAASGVLAAVAALAAWLPARRATKIDPVAVLRES
jgi:putative ABC transport system permease protein